MASGRVPYEQALGVWEERMGAGDFSIAPELGAVAILVPYLDGAEAEREEIERLPALKAEAYILADRLYARGIDTHVAVNAELEDFERVLTDPTISDITVIGHGCLTSFEVVNPETKDRLDWEDLAGMADHLKTGKFEQRVCGTLPRKLNVPIGLLTVTDHRNVRAIVGRRVTTEELRELGDSNLPAVTDLPKMEFEDIKTAFPQRKLSMASRAHVAAGALKQAVLSGHLPK